MSAVPSRGLGTLPPPRAIATDLDGSLLLPGGALDEETAAFLRDYCTRGGIVILATSRHLCDCTEIFSRVIAAGRGYIIPAAGAAVYDSSLRPLKTFPALTHEDFQAIICAYRGCLVTAVTDGVDYLAGRISPTTMARTAVIALNRTLKQNRRFQRARLAPRGRLPDDAAIEKVIVRPREENMPCPPELAARYNVMTRPSLRRIEFQHKEEDKALALAWLLEQLGVARDEIVVFGDDENDRAMISSFPRSFAMGNATPGIKKLASHVIPSNRERGILLTLREILTRREEG